MYVLSISSFAANWLLLCLISPLCSGAERAHWVPYEVNDPMPYQFPPMQTDKGLPSEERQHQTNIQNYEHRKLYYDYKAPQLENQKLLKQKSDIGISRLDHRNKESQKKDEEIMKNMNILNKMLSEIFNESDVESNTIEDKIIAESTISEETKRVVRQVRKQRPGFFWTLARLAFEV